MQVSWLFVSTCSSVRVAPWYTSLRTCRCFVSFYCWGCGQLFSLPIWVRRVAALVSLLRRHGGVVLFGERGARCSSAADSVPASLSGWGGSSAARFFFSCIGFFGGRLLAASTGGFASRVLLPAQRFVIFCVLCVPSAQAILSLAMESERREAAIDLREGKRYAAAAMCTAPKECWLVVVCVSLFILAFTSDAFFGSFETLGEKKCYTAK